MARVFVKQAAVQLLTAAAATIYTVGANRRGLVRYIHFFNEDTVARLVTVSLGVDAAGTRIFQSFSIAAGSPYDHYCLYVLNAADTVQAYADVASKVTITVNGEEEVLV